MSVFVKKQGVLESFSVLLEPFVLDALFCGRAIGRDSLHHPEEEVLAVGAHVYYLLLNCIIRVKVLVVSQHLVSCVSLKEGSECQQVVE